MDKEQVVYIHNGKLLSHKKDEMLPFGTTWMDPDGMNLSEIGQTDKDKYHRISVLFWNLKSKTNE